MQNGSVLTVNLLEESTGENLGGTRQYKDFLDKGKSMIRKEKLINRTIKIKNVCSSNDMLRKKPPTRKILENPKSDKRQVCRVCKELWT